MVNTKESEVVCGICVESGLKLKKRKGRMIIIVENVNKELNFSLKICEKCEKYYFNGKPIH